MGVGSLLKTLRLNVEHLGVLCVSSLSQPVSFQIAHCDVVSLLYAFGSRGVCSRAEGCARTASYGHLCCNTSIIHIRDTTRDKFEKKSRQSSPVQKNMLSLIDGTGTRTTSNQSSL